MGKGKNKRGNHAKPEAEQVKQIVDATPVENPLWVITIKFALLAAIVFGGLFYSDSEGYFEPDDKNNHTIKKWNAFYDFTKRSNVDILMVGSSHLYTGINPKNLSAALGVNAFILASPGTGMADSYFALKEALKSCEPKVVVIETYGIKKIEQYKLSKGQLSDQFKSFAARSDLQTKLLSTPSLFATKNYPYAWSYTLRNHDYLYNNKEQIEKNIEKKKAKKKEKKLYLGRYVRFQTGIKDSVLGLYDSLGAPVHGKEFEINNQAKHYVDRIVDICGENNIELIFLTLPMYEKHVDHYPDWKATITPLLGAHAQNNWLDLQDSAGYVGFTVHSFEDTYGNNQHMTYSGSLMATYRLANFILATKTVELPNRSQDASWRKTFYAEEGFFENHTPNANDTAAIILYQPEAVNSGYGKVSEILHIKLKKRQMVVAKVPIENDNFKYLEKQKLRMLVAYRNEQGQNLRSYIDMQYDPFHSTSYRMNFKQTLKKIEIVQILGLEFAN